MNILEISVVVYVITNLLYVLLICVPRDLLTLSQLSLKKKYEREREQLMLQLHYLEQALLEARGMKKVGKG